MTIPHISLHNLTFRFPDGTPLFSELSQQLTCQKYGLVGKNGAGKSTLLRLISNELMATAGSVRTQGALCYIPQRIETHGTLTVASLLGFADKLGALQRILHGSLNQADYDVLGDDWDIEQQAYNQLATFDLDYLPLQRKADSLSGGERTMLALCHAFYSDADFLLLDEPTNNLDQQAREKLYNAINHHQKGLIVVSHDRQLLNLMDATLALSSLGLKKYGGNYDYYAQQKQIEVSAAEQTVQAQKEIDAKAKKQQQIRKERFEQNQAKGNRTKLAEIKAKGSYNKMALNAQKGKSERTNKRIRMQAERKLTHTANHLSDAKKNIEMIEDINVKLPKTYIPSHKTVLRLEAIHFHYPDSQHAIINHCNFSIRGPERIALLGKNGSGKTTLVKLIMQELNPISGKLTYGTDKIQYLDQHASQLDASESVIDNFKRLNPDSSTNHAYACLAKFLFKNTAANKLVSQLSGGEKLRALLACVLLSDSPPQLLILDEPTNHLDVSSIEKIEQILQNYEGALLVISHDSSFLNNIYIQRTINLTARQDSLLTH